MVNSSRLADRYGTVLVTGGGGFVGRRLVARLRDEGLRCVHVASRSPSDVDEVELDISDLASTQRAIEKTVPDAVIHLAAQSSVGRSNGGEAATWATNLGGSLNVARAVSELAPSAAVLFASTVEVYGGAFNDGAVDEKVLPKPQSAYARSKYAAEQVFADVLTDQNRLIVARACNHSGSGQDTRFVLPSFAEQIARGDPEIRVGNLTPERHFLHVEDVVSAYLALLAAPSLKEQVYNIASDTFVSIQSILDGLLRIARSQAKVIVDPARLRPSDVPKAEIRATRLALETQWKPRFSLEDMLVEVMDDHRETK